MPRRGFPPTDGPDTYTAGTLFPRSSKKAARAINAASAATGRWWCWRTCPGSTARPSRCASCSWSTAPRSAGRSSTSDGPIVFCVISRYHGGAFVVFSKALNPNMTVLAAGGLVRLGDRRRPRRGGGVRRRRQQPHRQRPAGRASCEARVAARQRRRAGRADAPSWPRSAPRCGRRSSARWPPSSTGSTTSSAPVEVGSVDAIIRAAELRPQIIEAIEGHRL